MIVTLAGWTTEDVSDDIQAGRALVCLFDGVVDLALGGTLVYIDALLLVLLLGLGLVLGAVCDKSALDLVRVQETGFLAIGFVEVILTGVGTNV